MSVTKLSVLDLISVDKSEQTFSGVSSFGYKTYRWYSLRLIHFAMTTCWRDNLTILL